MRDHHIVLQEMGTMGTQPPSMAELRGHSPVPSAGTTSQTSGAQWRCASSMLLPWPHSIGKAARAQLNLSRTKPGFSCKESTNNSAWDDGRPLCFFCSNQNLQLEIICKRAWWLLQFPPPAPCPEQLSKTTSVHTEGQPEVTSSQGLQRHKLWEPGCMCSGSAQHPLPSPRWKRAGLHFHAQTAALSSAPHPCTRFTPEWAQALSP